MIEFTEDGCRCVIHDVHALPDADAYLHNDRLLVQINQRGLCKAAYLMQPPNLHYAEPLRCVYVRDDVTDKLWSAPFAPMQVEPDEFEFSAGLDDIRWLNRTDDVEVRLRLIVPCDDNVELWEVTAVNRSRRKRPLSIYPCFPVGKLSWMTQDASFDPTLNATVVTFFPPHARGEDYWPLRELKNRIALMASVKPTSWETSLEEFTGGRGLHDPGQLHARRLGRHDTSADAAVAAMQFSRTLAPGRSFTVRLALGPVKDHAEMRRVKRHLLGHDGIARVERKLTRFREQHRPTVWIDTPDEGLNQFVNHWLPKQMIFNGRCQRMSLGPGTRNTLQDAMGAVFVDPDSARRFFVRVFEHQGGDGDLAMSIKLDRRVVHKGSHAQSHPDMNIWPPLTVDYYVRETGDAALLDEEIAFRDGGSATLFEHVCRGLDWLLERRSKRGLCLMGDGDWNDPMNMVGLCGKGESVWMTQALAHSLDVWAGISDYLGRRGTAKRFRREADRCRRAVNRHAWDGQWYARGFTDAGDAFGVRKDREGRIYLNTQSWAIISGTATGGREDSCVRMVEENLTSPSGPEVLWPAYTRMREDIGRVSLKTPGTNENGSVYSHAAAFYAYALYLTRRSEHGFGVLRNLLPGGGGNTIERSGQLPLFIPNMYRGRACGHTAGRSSHHPGTGTAAWFYRILVGHLFGVRAEFDGLRIDPQLPREWQDATIERTFRGATYHITFTPTRGIKDAVIELAGHALEGNLVPIQPTGSRPKVTVILPALTS